MKMNMEKTNHNYVCRYVNETQDTIIIHPIVYINTYAY